MIKIKKKNLLHKSIIFNLYYVVTKNNFALYLWYIVLFIKI